MDLLLLCNYCGGNRSGRAPFYGHMSMSVEFHRVQSTRDILQNRRGRFWQQGGGPGLIVVGALGGVSLSLSQGPCIVRGRFGRAD